MANRQNGDNFGVYPVECNITTIAELDQPFPVLRFHFFGWSPK